MKNTEINKSIKNKRKSLKKNKIIDWTTLTYQEKLILAVALIGLIMLITTVINLLRSSKTTINYNKITGNELYTKAITNDDREAYWILNDIIATFIDSYNLELDSVLNTYKEKIVYSREDFYEVLSEEYKSKLSKKKYLDVSKTMLEKFVENGNYMKKSEYLTGVRKLNSYEYLNNMYICKLNTVDSTESYIGIQLYPNTKSYNIFYLE